MKYRILFLGTGNDALVIGRQLRASGGLILSLQDAQFHIDPGPGALIMAKMCGINVRNTTAVFLTSNNLFSANDVNAVISAMTYNGLDRKGVLVCPSSVINKSGFLKEFYKNCLEKCIVTDKIKKLGIEDVDIEVIQLQEKEKYAYKFITKKFNLTYLPDTFFYKELPNIIGKTDILIVNVPYPYEFREQEHMNSKDAETLIKKIKPELAILTGFGIKMLQSEPLYIAREIQKSTNVEVIAAKDGMTINPISFTTAVRQTKLK